VQDDEEDTGGEWYEKYSAPPSEAPPQEPQEPHGGHPEKIGGWRSFAEGLRQGATFGFSDELTAALESMMGMGDYEDLVAEERETLARARADHPWITAGGDILGSLPSSFIPAAGATKLGKFRGWVPKNLPVLAGKGGFGTKTAMTVLPETVGKGAKLGATMGAAEGLIRGTGEADFSDPWTAAKVIAGMGAFGGLVGAPAGAVGTKIGKALEARALRKATEAKQLTQLRETVKAVVNGDEMRPTPVLFQEVKEPLFEPGRFGPKRTQIRNDVKKAFLFTDEETDTGMALMDAIAKGQGFDTPEALDEWYKMYMVAVRRGDTPSDAALHSYRTLGKHQQEYTRWSSKRDIAPEEMFSEWGEIEKLGRKLQEAPELLPTETSKSPLNMNQFENSHALDVTPSCPRRSQYAAFVDQTEKNLGRNLQAEELFAMAEKMKAKGYTAPCAYCYAEASRRKGAQFLVNFANPESRTPALVDATKYPVRAKFMQKGKQIPDDLFVNPENYVSDRMYQKLYDEGISYMRGAKGNRTSPLLHSYSGQFLRQGLSTREKFVRGARFSGISDLTPPEVVDWMQGIIDLSIQGRNAYAYTKVPEVARVFGKTGLRINQSLAVHLGPDDAWSAVRPNVADGMNWGVARANREASENVGNTMVAMNDNQVLWALDQDWVDVVIPGHHSGAEGIAKQQGWIDYSKVNLEERFGAHPNYWKITNDVRDPGTQKAVKAVFDWDAADEWIGRWQAEGGFQKMTRAEKKFAKGYATELQKKQLLPVLEEKMKRNGRVFGQVEFENDVRTVMTAFEGADMETFVHETGHVFRRTLPKEELLRAEIALGVENGMWTREMEEAFTEEFVKYVRKGKTPNAELVPVFKKLRQWLMDIYKAFRGKGRTEGRKVNPQLRKLFDDMLGSKSPEQLHFKWREGSSDDLLMSRLSRKDPRYIAHAKEHFERMKNAPTLQENFPSGEVNANSAPVRMAEDFDNFKHMLNDVEEEVVELIDDANITMSTEELFERIEKVAGRQHTEVDDFVTDGVVPLSEAGEQVGKAQQRVQAYRDRMIAKGVVKEVVDEEGKKTGELIHRNISAAELREFIQTLRADNKAWGKQLGAGITPPERALMDLSEGLSEWLKDAVGPEYRELMTRYAKMMRTFKNMEKQTRVNNWFQNRIKKPVQDMYFGGQAQTVTMDKRGTSWLRTIRDFGDIVGTDYETMVVDRLVLSELFPDLANPGDAPTLTAKLGGMLANLTFGGPLGVARTAMSTLGESVPQAGQKILYQYVSGSGLGSTIPAGVRMGRKFTLPAAGLGKFGQKVSRPGAISAGARGAQTEIDPEMDISGLGPYAAVLRNAQTRGGADAVAATIYVLQHNDPKFRKLWEERQQK
jgi:hypothetical protein